MVETLLSEIFSETFSATFLGLFLVSMFSMGLLGSTHCAVMCGPLAAASCRSRANNEIGPKHELLYHATRLAAYGLFGATLGYLGVGLLQGSFRLYSSIASMGLSIVFGLVGVSVLASAVSLEDKDDKIKLGKSKDTLDKTSGPRGAWSATFSRMILKGVSGPSQLFLNLFQGSIVDRALPRSVSAGLLSALLPCGLLYSALLQSVLSPGPWHAGFGMVVFGLGTVPGLWISLRFFSKAHRYISLKRVRLAMAFVLLSMATVLFVKSWNSYSAECAADTAQQSS